MGTSTHAMMVATADQVARLTGSSTNVRSARIPQNAKNITAVVVSRGSQSHHTPQVGLAQMEPWQQSRPESTTPISTPASWRASHLKSDRQRYASAQAKAQVNARSEFQAVGTCTYMIRYTSPMNASAGARNRPM